MKVFCTLAVLFTLILLTSAVPQTTLEVIDDVAKSSSMTKTDLIDALKRKIVLTDEYEVFSVILEEYLATEDSTYIDVKGTEFRNGIEQYQKKFFKKMYKQIAKIVGAKEEWIDELGTVGMTLESTGIDYQTYKILTRW